MKIYQENIKKHEAKAIILKKILNKTSMLRLFIFIISVIVIIYLLSTNRIYPTFFVLPISILCFAFILKYHNKIAFQKKHTSFLKSINQSEILKIECKLEEFDTGKNFIDPNHPYTSDLDIFGQHSIFQLVNRTTTESGTLLLSQWLSKPATNFEIHERQEAIKELSKKLNWRQEFQASGMHYQNNKSDYNKLLEWAKSPILLLKNQHLYTISAIALSVVSLLSFYLFIINLYSIEKYIIYLFILITALKINYIILGKIKTIAENIVETSQHNINSLRAYRILIKEIEHENFKSKKLQQLKLVLLKKGYSAYNEINKLCKLLDFSQQRSLKNIPMSGNYFYSLLNSFLLLDIYLILGVERWKSKNRLYLESWSAAVSEFEVLNSFAGFSYSNPTYAFPEITEEDNFVHFESLGHPLINSGTRVCNNFYSAGQGNVVMITGSNMAGKSTFLRTVGVNIVLALAGAPCCAKSGKISNLKLYTSMRTQDNLKDGISSFFAELDRIEKMLKLTNQTKNVFFLLDEMFKGTNSEDRHKGGFSLINQLSKLNTSGIIATHDIELAKLSEHRKLVTNYSFNSEITNNSMTFSYEIIPAICNDFNASELMKRSGIDILPNF